MAVIPLLEDESESKVAHRRYLAARRRIKRAVEEMAGAGALKAVEDADRADAAANLDDVEHDAAGSARWQ